MQAQQTGFWARHDQRGMYLTAKEKREMVSMRETFIVTGVSESDGQFGPRWNLTIEREDGYGPSPRILTFAKNENRDAMFDDLRQEVRTEPVPASLGMVQSDAGNDFYVLNPPTWEGEE